MRPRRVAIALGAAALAAAAPAAAAPGLEIGIEDERLLLGSPSEAPGFVSAWAATGVDVVRIHARWSEIAPGRSERRRPRGFHAGSHSDPAYHWDGLDAAIALVRSNGLKVMLTITGPGPLWTSRAPARRNPRYKPDPRAFGLFARAVATRYGADVDRYLVWNEPNQPGWLDPQLACIKRVCTPVAPHLYRGLVNAAVPAIKAADPGAEVVIGELAPLGREPISVRAPLAPLPFLRAMACVDERYRRLPRRGACAGYRPPYADSIGHHPHGVLSAPDEPTPNLTWAKIADIPRLFRVLDRLTSMGRLVAPDGTGGRFTLHLTEFGYQTSPPDHAIGVTLDQQARYLQQAAYIAWRHPRVRSLVHYQWQDEPVRYRAPGTLAYAGWQSGLFFVNGKPKPALQGFEAPFVADLQPGATRARFWGQVRPGGNHTITLLRRGSGGEFVAVANAQTDGYGYWTHDMPVDGDGDYRFTWTAPTTDPGAPSQTRSSGTVGLRAGAAKRVQAASAGEP